MGLYLEPVLLVIKMCYLITQLHLINTCLFLSHVASFLTHVMIRAVYKVYMSLFSALELCPSMVKVSLVTVLLIFILM